MPGPPASVDVVSRGATHMDLVWTAPYEPNGAITGYQIFYQTGLNKTHHKSFIHVIKLTENYWQPKNIFFDYDQINLIMKHFNTTREEPNT